MKIVQISMKVKPNLKYEGQTEGTMRIYTFCGDKHQEYENSKPNLT